jgi:hypothetical protein
MKRAMSPVAMDAHVLGTLKFIRKSIETSGAIPIPGTAGLAMGVIGLMACSAASLPMLRAQWQMIWLIAAPIALLAGALLMARNTFSSGQLPRVAAARKFLLALSPALFAGTVLTFVLKQIDATSLLAPTWLLLYGCAVVSCSPVTSAVLGTRVAAMGVVFMLLGAVTYAVPMGLHNLALGFGFGGLHLAFGLLIGRLQHEH